MQLVIILFAYLLLFMSLWEIYEQGYSEPFVFIEIKQG